jgi:hypothetical protein
MGTISSKNSRFGASPPRRWKRHLKELGNSVDRLGYRRALLPDATRDLCNPEALDSMQREAEAMIGK